MRATNFQGIITATLTPNTAVDAIMSDLGSGFCAIGAAVRTVFHTPSYPNPRLMLAMMVQLRDEGVPAFILNCNGKDRLVVGEERGREITVHEAWGLPLVAFLVDHPAAHLPHLLRAPENALITVIDQGHLAFLEQAGLPPRSHLFCPHGGPEAIADPLPARERGISLLFSGNVGDPGPESEWLNRVCAGQSELRAILSEALEAVRAEQRDPYAAIQNAYGRRGRAATPLTVAKYVNDLDVYAMMSRRFDVLRAITRHRVTVLGDVTGTNALAHHETRGTTSFAKTRSLMADTKLLLNSRSTFGRGGHERIFYGLSRGAVVATESSSFLSEDLQTGLGMVQLPARTADLNDFLSDLLAQPDRLDEVRQRGLAQYTARHSWRERARRILDALEAHAGRS